MESVQPFLYLKSLFYVSSNCTTRGAKREIEGKYAFSDLPIES